MGETKAPGAPERLPTGQAVHGSAGGARSLSRHVSLSKTRVSEALKHLDDEP